MRTVVEMGEALARGEVSAVELATESLAAAREVEQRCHAFVAIDDDAALAAARDADRRRAAGEGGPLLGIPIAVKDDTEVAGRIASWGRHAAQRSCRAGRRTQRRVHPARRRRRAPRGGDPRGRHGVDRAHDAA